MSFVHTGVMVDVSELKTDASVFERSFYDFSGIRKNRIFELAELEQLTFLDFYQYLLHLLIDITCKTVIPDLFCLDLKLTSLRFAHM